jgi:hypothetical protein
MAFKVKNWFRSLLYKIEFNLCRYATGCINAKLEAEVAELKASKEKAAAAVAAAGTRAEAAAAAAAAEHQAEVEAMHANLAAKSEGVRALGRGCCIAPGCQIAHMGHTGCHHLIRVLTAK